MNDGDFILTGTCLEPDCGYTQTTDSPDGVAFIAGQLKRHRDEAHPEPWSFVPDPDKISEALRTEPPEELYLGVTHADASGFHHGQTVWLDRGNEPWEELTYVAPAPPHPDLDLEWSVVVTPDRDLRYVLTSCLRSRPADLFTTIIVRHPNTEIDAILELLERNPNLADLEKSDAPPAEIAARRWRKAIKEQAG